MENRLYFFAELRRTGRVWVWVGVVELLVGLLLEVELFVDLLDSWMFEDIKMLSLSLKSNMDPWRESVIVIVPWSVP